MSVEGSSATASENVARKIDITSSAKDAIDLKFQKESLLSGINSSRRDTTQLIKQNGSTEGARLQVGELMLAPPKMTPFKEYFKAIQKWEGKVVSLSTDTFRAILSPLVGERIEQEAEIYVQDVTPDERSLIEPGAIFYWSIGYLERPSGRVRESVIRFRRLPTWTNFEVTQVGKDLASYFTE